MIEEGLGWLKRNMIDNRCVAISDRQRAPYPEVTGYWIPTLLKVGEIELAENFARFLVSIQNPDGSFSLQNTDETFVFDTGQIIRGWAAIAPRLPEVREPMRKACEWIIAGADPHTGKFKVPPPGNMWSLGSRGEVNEGIHLYVIQPLRDAAAILDAQPIQMAAHRALKSYIDSLDVTAFDRPNALTHFYTYMQEALVETGMRELAVQGMNSAARFQQANGAVPAYADVPWICSPGLAQLAKVWYLLGDKARGDAALGFVQNLQNHTGGFYGSYGVGATYFPADEISWAVKYAIDAELQSIENAFNATVGMYAPTISANDGRAEAVLDACQGAGKILDAGCGKGRYAALVKERYPAADVFGTDISDEMLAAVPPSILTKKASLQCMPFADNEFDVVYCIEALEHAPNPRAAVEEMARLVKAGGKLVIIDKNAEKLGALQIEKWEKWFDRNELAEILKNCGFDCSVSSLSYDGHPDDGLFLCWMGTKKAARPKATASVKGLRLVCITNDPLRKYAHYRSEDKIGYFNPCRLFDEVYCVSPFETEAYDLFGMHVIPTPAADFANRVRELNADCVRAYDLPVAKIACAERVENVPVICSVHDVNRERFAGPLPNADYFMALSGAVEKFLLQLNADPSRIIKFNNRVNMDVFRPFRDKARQEAFDKRFPGKHKILHVGRIETQKNQETLVAALSLLDKDYACLFIGKGDVEPYKDLAKRLNVAERCYFVDSVMHNELPDYYNFCDCFCTPSRWEGFGIVFIEALACGAVVVTSDIPPMNEYIQNGENGILVRNYIFAEDLAKAIKKAVHDDALRKRIQQNALKAAEPFSSTKVEARERAIYEMALRAWGRRP